MEPGEFAGWIEFIKLKKKSEDKQAGKLRAKGAAKTRPPNRPRRPKR